MVDSLLDEAVTGVKNKPRPDTQYPELVESSLAEVATANRFFVRPRRKPDRQQPGADTSK